MWMGMLNQADGGGMASSIQTKGYWVKKGGTTPDNRDPDQKCETLLTLPMESFIFFYILY